MREWQSQSHVRWYCKYHVVFVPKYRKRGLYGTLRRNIGGLLRELCRQHGVELVEGHAMPDHIHLCSEHSTEIQRGQYGGVSQGQVGNSDPPGVSAAEEAIHRLSLLGSGLLREHGRVGGG